MLIARGGLKNKHKKKPNQTTLDILVEDGHLTNRDEEKTDTFSAAFFFFLPQSLMLLVDLGLPGPPGQRTKSVGTVTFHLWILKF